MGITANSNYRRAFDEGKQMPGKWVLTPNGTPTSDPAVLFDEDQPGVAMGEETAFRPTGLIRPRQMHLI